MTLYEIDSQLQSLVDPETGEIVDFEAFERLQMDREAKIENVALWVKNLEAEAAAIKAEKQNLEARQKAAEHKAARLRRYLSYALDGQKFSTPRVDIRWRHSEQVEVTALDLAIQWLTCHGHSDAIKRPEPTVDKAELKRLIKAGNDVPGTTVTINNNIQIK